jgi:glycosyltransferase involved in cell wall biosynthesis
MVFNSEAGRDALLPYFGYPRGTSAVIPNGKVASPKAELDAPREGIICVARRVPSKRQDLLIKALAKFRKADGPSATFIGSGTDADDFRRSLEAANIDARGLGELPDLSSYVKGALISALPTEHEGMPNVVLEAWNSGAAVIASKVPGVRDLVRHEVDGLLVDNNADAWHHGLVRLLEDASMRRRLVEAGRRRIEDEFSLTHTATRWAELYRDVVAEQQRGSK